MGLPVVIPHISLDSFYVRHQFQNPGPGSWLWPLTTRTDSGGAPVPTQYPQRKSQDRPHGLVGKADTFPDKFFNRVPITDTGTTGGPVGKDVPGRHNKFT